MIKDFNQLVRYCDNLSEQLYKKHLSKNLRDNRFGGSNKSLIIPFPFMTGTNKRGIGFYKTLKNTLEELKNKNTDSELVIDPSILINTTKRNSKNNQNYFKQYTVPLKVYNFVQPSFEDKKRYTCTSLYGNVNNLYKKFINWEEYQLYVIDLITFINLRNEEVLKVEFKIYTDQLKKICKKQNLKDYKIEDFTNVENISYKFMFFYFLKLYNSHDFASFNQQIEEIVIFLISKKDDENIHSNIEQWLADLRKKYSNKENMKKIYDNDSFIFAFRTYSGGSINFRQIERHIKMFDLAKSILIYEKKYANYEDFEQNYPLTVYKYFESFINENLKSEDLEIIISTIFDVEYLKYLWSTKINYEKASRNISEELKNKVRIRQNNTCLFHKTVEEKEIYAKYIKFDNKDQQEYLEFHHIIPHYYSKYLKNSEYINDYKNIVGLCPLCHAKIEYSYENDNYFNLKQNLFNNLDEKYIKKIYDNLIEEEKIYYTSFEDFKEKNKN